MTEYCGSASVVLHVLYCKCCTASVVLHVLYCMCVLSRMYMRCVHVSCMCCHVLPGCTVYFHCSAAKCCCPACLQVSLSHVYGCDTTVSQSVVSTLQCCMLCVAHSFALAQLPAECWFRPDPFNSDNITALQPWTAVYAVSCTTPCASHTRPQSARLSQPVAAAAQQHTS
jgi:hypothetical protein